MCPSYDMNDDNLVSVCQYDFFRSLVHKRKYFFKEEEGRGGEEEEEKKKKLEEEKKYVV